MAKDMKQRVKQIITLLRRTYWGFRIRSRAAACGEDLKVNFASAVTRNTYLGTNVNFNGMKIEGQGKVMIGSNFHSGRECLMITSNHNYDSGSAIPYDDTYTSKDITIEDNVWLGTRVLVLGGVTIGEGAIIQAGAVVVGDIPKLGIAGGNPATVFKYRDRDHYEARKAERSFH